MSSRLFQLFIGFILAGSMSALAATKAPKKARHAVKHKVAGAKLQTDIRFSDSVVRGKYASPDGAVARVENEKALTELLSVRKNFKDRLKEAKDEN